MKLSQSLSQNLPITSVYSAKQVLENEAIVAQSQNIGLFELMQSAGAAVFEQLLKSWPNPAHILILCGKGNNGGDGFILAKLAHQANMKTSVLLTCTVSELKGDALRAYQMMTSAGVSLIADDIGGDKNIEGSAFIKNFTGDVIVDALFGIGFKGKLTEPLRSLVKGINYHDAKVISIDVPSGLCSTTGQAQGKAVGKAVIADVTVAFIVYKQGLLTGQAANFVGELLLAPLMINTTFIKQVKTDCFYSKSTLPVNLPKRLPASHKGDSGLLLTVGGGLGMPGAIRLASEAALRCGVGLVSVSCHQLNQSLVVNGRPELMLAPTTSGLLTQSQQLEKAKGYLIGPGLGQDNEAEQLFYLLCESSRLNNKFMVVDADALTLLSRTKRHNNNWILTPHPKEAAALLDCDVETIEADRFAAARAIASQYGGICLLKGAGSLISDGQCVVINNSGNAGMASGGMGDVLSGVISALVLQSEELFYSTCLAAYIHGAAADIIANKNGQRGLLASDLFIPLQQILNDKVLKY
jgi:NAD(P)H-hydrate epimerase